MIRMWPLLELTENSANSHTWALSPWKRHLDFGERNWHFGTLEHRVVHHEQLQKNYILPKKTSTLHCHLTITRWSSTRARKGQIKWKNRAWCMLLHLIAVLHHFLHTVWNLLWVSSIGTCTCVCSMGWGKYCKKVNSFIFGLFPRTRIIRSGCLSFIRSAGN